MNYPEEPAATNGGEQLGCPPTPNILDQIRLGKNPVICSWRSIHVLVSGVARDSHRYRGRERERDMGVGDGCFSGTNSSLRLMAIDAVKDQNFPCPGPVHCKSTFGIR